MLELLAALAVLGLLLVLLTQGVRFGVRASGLRDRAVAARGDLETADRALRQAIQAMDPGTYTEPPRIAGGPHALSFTADLPLGALGADRPRAEMEVVLDGRRLVLRWAPHVHAELFGPAPPPRESVLADGVEGLDIAYAARGGAWSGAWTAQALPALVRVGVAFPKGDARRWPPIIAAPVRERSEE